MAAPFPWLEAFVLAPCAVLAACGVKVQWTATALVLDMLWDSAALIWTQTCAQLTASSPCYPS